MLTRTCDAGTGQVECRFCENYVKTAENSKKPHFQCKGACFDIKQSVSNACGVLWTHLGNVINYDMQSYLTMFASKAQKLRFSV